MHLIDGPAEGAIAVTVTSLEMTSPGDLVPATGPDTARWYRIESDKASHSRDLYLQVGGPWHWVDRRDWPLDTWRAWTDRAEHHLLVCTMDGTGETSHAPPAGYAELEQQADGAVEIAYFGLLPESIGKGLGRWWLAEVIGEAWRLPGTRRVWVHTCTLDSPAALATYVGRGMRPFATEVEWRLPDNRGGMPRLAP